MKTYGRGLLLANHIRDNPVFGQLYLGYILYSYDNEQIQGAFLEIEDFNMQYNQIAFTERVAIVQYYG